jgi:TetR/AcrR family transcriptional regulator, transcriptional repressor for nem operon
MHMPPTASQKQTPRSRNLSTEMVAALGSDMTRQGKRVRRALTAYVRAQIDQLAGWTDGSNAAARRRRAIATLAGMVGALILARTVDDAVLSDEILAAGRATQRRNVRRQRL